MYDYNSFLPIENTFCTIVGNSGSGKSSFCKILCDYITPEKKIYYYNSNRSLDFQLKSKPIVVLQDISFDQDWIKKNIIKNSVLILDDFNINKTEVAAFRALINYYCRHNLLTLIIIVHSLFKTNIFNEINLSSNIFLLKSESSRQIASRKKVIKAYNTLISSKLIKQLLYINLVDEYSISFNSDILLHTLTPINMFTQNDIFTVHIKGATCPDSDQNEEDEDNTEIYNQYSSKNRRKIFFILQCFKKNEILKNDLVIVGKSNFMHIYDVLSIFLNPFPKNMLSKIEISFMKRLKISTKTFPLPRHIIPIHLKKYL